MGNVISKVDNPADQLFRFEEKILNAEAHLIKLRRKRIPKRLIFVSGMLIAIFCGFVKLGYISMFLLSSIVLTGTVTLNNSFNNRRIRMAEYKLKTLKECQKAFVKECKLDEAFSKTRRLIEKYEDEESRETFFKTVIEKKRTGVDRLGDFILANDPAQMNALICSVCGQHNGLIDPCNRSISYFYCYSCKERTDRVVRKNGEGSRESTKAA